MPQLDVYIICNLVHSVIIILLLIYVLNISNSLLLINISMRMNKLKIYSDKIYIYNVLKYIIYVYKIPFVKNILLVSKNSLEIIKKCLFFVDILDVLFFQKKTKEIGLYFW